MVLKKYANLGSYSVIDNKKDENYVIKINNLFLPYENY